MDSQQSNSQVKIGLARVYTKDISFESPLAPKVFTKKWSPEINLQVGVQSQKIENNLWEVTLQLEIQANEGDTTGFIIELEHCGLFEIEGATNSQLNEILTVFCPSTIFPYARQVVDQLLNLGGFPPLMLAPLNFEFIRREASTGATSAKAPIIV